MGASKTKATITKAQLQRTIDDLHAEVVRLRDAVALARQDERDANKRSAQLETRHLLVKVRLGRELVDAVVIPPSGRMSSPVTISLVDPNECIEMYTEPIS